MSLRQFYKELRKKQSRIYRVCKKNISGKRIIEIGGPSKVFSQEGILPIYGLIAHLDNCNYSKNTIWKDHSFFPKNPLGSNGKEFIAEATSLNSIDSEGYDGILSSHVIEHSANPLLALSEWIRVVKENGFLILLVPHRDGTFDHQRPVTALAHMIEDYENGVNEKDPTHLPEILKLHDLKRDPLAGSFDDFKSRSLKNYENRSLHHHVFDTQSVVKMVDYMRLKILSLDTKLPCHIIILARKLSPGHLPDNRIFFGEMAKYKFHSPFVSDTGRSEA